MPLQHILVFGILYPNIQQTVFHKRPEDKYFNLTPALFVV